MRKFALGETVALRVWVKDIDGDLVDPSTGVYVSIWDSSNTLKVDSIAMDTDETGIYYYYYAIPATGTVGRWRVRFESVAGAHSSYKKDQFAVVREEALD